MTIAPGTVFAGEYRVVRLLKDGAMGAVYEAEQLATGKSRALETMPARLATDPTLRVRFAQEARSGAQIPSEHVAEVIGAGIDPITGMPWLARELLHGETLAARLDREGPLGRRLALTILDHVCHALEAGHGLGVVHGDLRPENVFLSDPGRRDPSHNVKVLDFGVARWLFDAGAAEGLTDGAPLFRAPEQLRPGEPITPGADVWALGLLMFTVFTGRPYWRAAERRPVDLAALRAEVLDEPIVQASKRARSLRKEDRLPVGFDDWFDRCVDRDLRRRFPHAAAARSAFDVVKLRMLSRTDAWPAVRPPEPKGRGAVLVVAGAGALVGGAGLAAVLLWSGPAPEPPKPAPVVSATASGSVTGPTPSAAPLAASAAPGESAEAPEVPPATAVPAPPPPPPAPSHAASSKAPPKPSAARPEGEDSANPYR